MAKHREKRSAEDMADTEVGADVAGEARRLRNRGAFVNPTKIGTGAQGQASRSSAKTRASQRPFKGSGDI